MEETEINHVPGNMTSDDQFFKEFETLLVGIMRDGEPMALGVNEVFPPATFLHAKTPADIKRDYLKLTKTVILVDAVINEGKTIVNFIEYLRATDPNPYSNSRVRIVLVTGVLQKNSILEGGLIYNVAKHEKVDVVALRLSDNKYIGKGSTDTGARLFNTTNLE